ncbi:hypothetical protein BV22DRAFT_256216 [Leucogyrophana mollusca]|uniref:Uncharacterized protein n=1 Tax=Leucogyrophana mollusca TaxID=85980 RepID=A0ACB8BRM7_9AGAM|nr:hypothetical protein BV22DRAFT_256216 [Leucogyrophana mollusca]
MLAAATAIPAPIPGANRDAPGPAAANPATPLTPKASVTITQSTNSSTPTLKIRLPRLSAVSAASNSASTTVPSKPTRALSPTSAQGASVSDDSRPRRSSRRQDSIPLSLSAVSSFTTDGGDDPDLAKPSMGVIPLYTSTDSNFPTEYKPKLGGRKFFE